MSSLGLYIHVPWCKRRCPYCDFYFEVGKPDGGFVAAIKAEWQARKAAYLASPGISLYFGGGTPSLLPVPVMEELSQFFYEEGALGPDAEITIEANPEDLKPQFIAALRQTKVNRLSLGVQSFDDGILKFLGRMHTGEQARQSIFDLKQAGFDNISVDLILGVLGESRPKILHDLDFLSDIGVPHISAYLLTIEPKTHFFKQIEQKKMTPASEDQQVEIFCAVQEKLKSSGYEQYDISSYARHGQFSRHNQIYWGVGSYLGLGPSAHSMRLMPDGAKERRQNRADVRAWLVNPASDDPSLVEILDNQSALLESLAFGLRNMAVGIDPQKLAFIHQASLPKNWLLVIKKFMNSGWLEENDGVYNISPAGALFADAVMRDILCL